MTPILTLTLSLLISGAPTGLQGTPLTCSIAPDALAAVQTALGGIGALAVCVADCNPYPDVSCQASTCSAQDRNCNVGHTGWVKCNGTYTYCGPVCASCCQSCENHLNTCLNNCDNPLPPCDFCFNAYDTCVSNCGGCPG